MNGIYFFRKHDFVHSLMCMQLKVVNNSSFLECDLPTCSVIDPMKRKSLQTQLLQKVILFN